MNMSLQQIRDWLNFHKKRQLVGDKIPSLSEISLRAGLSRQTLYAVLRNERTEFGQIAQTRLSRIIMQINAEPNYQRSRLARIDMQTGQPRIRFGV
jgi:hypothetical protein